MNSDVEAKSALPPIRHIGVVVKDVEQAVAYYASVFGIGQFRISELNLPECMLYGKPAPSRFKVAMARMEPVEVELIQVLEGGQLHAEFLRTNGEGLHHLGIHVGDFDTHDRLVTEMQKQGVGILLSTRDHRLAATYLDTRANGGIILEIYHSEGVE